MLASARVMRGMAFERQGPGNLKEADMTMQRARMASSEGFKSAVVCFSACIKLSVDLGFHAYRGFGDGGNRSVTES